MFSLAYPVKEILGGLGMLLDKNTFNVDENVAIMKKTQKCEVKNVAINKEFINNYMEQFDNLEFSNGEIGTLFLHFPRTFLMNEIKLSIDELTLDFKKVEKIRNNKKVSNESDDEEEGSSVNISSILNIIGKLINTIVKNLSLTITKIKIRLFVSDSLSYCIMIKKIEYIKTPNAPEIESQYKLKYSFLHNKTFIFNSLIIKENANENDDTFFNDSIDNKVAFYTQSDILFLFEYNLVLNITQDINTQIVQIKQEDNNKSSMAIESIITTNQLNNLFSLKDLFNISQKEKVETKVVQKKSKKRKSSSDSDDSDSEDSERDEKKTEVKNEEKSIDDNEDEKKTLDIFGISLNNISFKTNIEYIYFMIVNNSDKSIPKFWLMYQKYFSKLPKYQFENIVLLLEKHYCYYKNIFYYFLINNINLNLDLVANFKLKTNCSIGSTLFRMIIPITAHVNHEIFIPDDYLNSDENDNNKDSIKTFNYIFIPFYLENMNKYLYLKFVIIDINDFNIVNSYNFEYKSFYIEINLFVIYKIISLFKPLISDDNKIVEIKNNQNNKDDINNNLNNINSNLQNNKKKKKQNISLKGNIYIKLIVNKNRKMHIENDLIYLDTEYHNTNIQIALIDFIIQFDNTNSNILFFYKKLIICLYMKNIAYPFFCNLQNENEPLVTLNKSSSNFDININKICLFIKISYIIKIYSFIKQFVDTSDIFKKLSPPKEKNITKENNDKQVINLKEMINKYINQFKINEINFIVFTKLFSNSIDIVKFNEKKDETSFNMIKDPIIKIQILLIDLDKNNDSINLIINNLKGFFCYKNNYSNTFLYDYFINNKQYDSFEKIIYNASEDPSSKICEVTLENNTISTNIFNLSLCPFTLYSNQIVELLIIEYEEFNKKMKRVKEVKKNESAINEEIFSNSGTINDQNTNDFIIILKINNLFIDIYSNNNQETLNPNSNVDINNNSKRNLMRCIFQLSNINLTYDSLSNIHLNINEIYSIFINDLEDSLCLKEINTNEFKMKNEESFCYNKIGFIKIISLINLIIDTNLNLKNNSLILEEISVYLCLDTTKYLVKLISEIKDQISQLNNDDDKEQIKSQHFRKSVKLQDDLKNEKGGYEVKQVGKSIYNYKFSNKLNNNSPSVKSFQSKNSKKSNVSPTDNKNKNSQIINHDNIISTKNNYNSNDLNDNLNINKLLNNNISSTYIESTNSFENTSSYNGSNMPINNQYNSIIFKLIGNQSIKLLLKSINIYIYSGEDFAYLEERIKEQKNNNLLNRKKRRSENIQIQLESLKLDVKYNRNEQLVLDVDLIIDSILLHDHIKDSMYKIALSHYDFTNKNNIFLALKTQMLKYPNENGESELKAIIEISPISIYLDQPTFEFILNFYFAIQDLINNKDGNTIEIINKDNENKKDKESSHNYTIERSDNEISGINGSQYKFFYRVFQITIDPKFINITKFIINEFFINFNYNARNFKLKNVQQKKYYEFINLLSVSELIIKIKEFNYSSDKGTKLVCFLKEIIDFYYEDLIKQSAYSYFKSIPFNYGCRKVGGGIGDMITFPFNSNENNIPIGNSMVNGVRSFVKSSTLQFLCICESTSGFFKGLCCCNCACRNTREGNENENEGNRGKSIYRLLKYKIDGYEKEKDDYYLK